MFALKCWRCSNLRVQSHGDLIFRQWPPSSFTRSFSYTPRYVVDHNHKRQSEKQAETNDIKHESFYDMINRRRDEALRSVLISFQQGGEQNVVPFLESLKGVKHTFFYGPEAMGKKYVLVEFSSIQEANSILADATLNTNLSFQAEGRVLEMRKTKTRSPQEKLSITWNQLEPTTNFLFQEMKTCQNMDLIMNILLKNVEACDLTTRLHFITCVQIERIFLGAFPKVRVIPFGSSVNGFGRKGSDLDITLLLNHRLTFSRMGSQEKEGSLMLRPSETDYSPRELLQLFGRMLPVMFPSCSHVITLPHARVPIIKFKDFDTGCECDLNFSQPLGICMSEILYTLSSWDVRCRSLVFTVRAWAACHGLTNIVSPTTKITNFSLILLVVHFLQMRRALPTIREMEQLADDRDLIVYEGEPHLFLRHVSREKIAQWKKMTGKGNKDSTFQLLADFFSYYSTFPFDSNAISITSGNLVNNPTREPMYIINPLDMTHNVARNVREVNVDLFRDKCKEAVPLTGKSQALLHTPVDRWAALFNAADPASKKKPRSNLILELFEKGQQNKEENVRGSKKDSPGKTIRR